MTTRAGVLPVLLLAALPWLACEDPSTPETPPQPCDAIPWYPDVDGDGWGDEFHPFFACSQPAGLVEQVGDCDDTTASVNPSALEECDQLDNNCDGQVDESWAPGVSYRDLDGDGYGQPDHTQTYLCELPEGYVEDDQDCDDDDPTVFPGAEDELCDGVDADCDGSGVSVRAVIGSVEFETIQAAIDGADDGDVVSICPGTHHELLEIPDYAQIELDSFTRESEDTVLDGEGMRQLLSIGDDAVVRVSQLSFVNGAASFYANGTGFRSNGGAIHSCAASLSIDQCVFTGNAAWSNGGAVAMRNEPERGCGHESEQFIVLEIVDSVFEDNVGTDYSGGGAIAVNVLRNARVSIQGTEIRDSSSGHQGGALYAIASDALDIEFIDSVVAGAETENDGGGLYASCLGSIDLRLSGSEFSGHWAGYEGGAIFLEADHDVTASFDGATIHDNYSDYKGGGMMIDAGGQATVDIVASHWTQNRSDYSGGALALEPNDHLLVSMTDSSFEGNQSLYDAGVLSADASTMSIDIQGCVFADNTADTYGGALVLDGGSGTATLVDSELTGNTAGSGGGAIDTNLDETVLDGVEISGNTGQYGGGIYLASSSPSPELHLTDCEISSNVGGGVYMADHSFLYSEISNWGSGITDNDPFDVRTEAFEYDIFTTGESFTCEGLGYCY